MFARIANINMESVDPRELKLKAGNSCFAMQHGQSDAFPSMRADSLLVLRHCCLSKTNKTFKVKLILERLPSLLKDPQDPKDHEVLRLKWHQLQRNAQHLQKKNEVSGKVYYTFHVNYARDWLVSNPNQQSSLHILYLNSRG